MSGNAYSAFAGVVGGSRFMGTRGSDTILKCIYFEFFVLDFPKGFKIVYKNNYQGYLLTNSDVCRCNQATTLFLFLSLTFLSLAVLILWRVF